MWFTDSIVSALIMHVKSAGDLKSDYAWEKIMQTKQKIYGVVATAILKLSKVLDSDILVLLVVI